jgi:excisionase family DNA binding protein
MNQETFEKLLNAREVCTLLNVSRRTLNRICKRKCLAYILVGGSYRFRPAAIRYFLDKNSVGSIGRAA